jgi:hypothetical protein
MFRSHSFLWHYLWLAPNLLLLFIGLLMWRRGLVRRIPAFFAFAVLSALTELIDYAADVIPSVSGTAYWRVAWVGLFVQGIVKFVLIGEIFAHVFGSYESVARLGKYLIRAVGVVLVFAAALAAAYAPQNSPFGIISGAYLLEQAIYLIESGLLLFVFVFAFYCHLVWDRPLLGVTLGLSISSCVHLASWAILDNSSLSESRRMIFTFLNMATYHASVLIWFYYLLTPGKVAVKPAVPLPEHNLEAWNRELERVLHP